MAEGAEGECVELENGDNFFGRVLAHDEAGRREAFGV